MDKFRAVIKTAMCVCFAVLIAAAALDRASAASGKMTVTAIDLGESNTGEATMITAGDGKSLLVDSGDTHNRSIFNWLDANGYKNKKFDTLVTHWHDDHAGNTARIIEQYNVGTVYIPTISYLEEVYHPYYRYERSFWVKIMKAAKERGTKVVYLKKGKTIKVGSGVSGKVLYINGSPRRESNGMVGHINNESAVIMFSGGGCRYLNAGDIQTEAENRLLKSGVNLEADIFKVSHHGYNTSNQMKFLKAVDPTYAYFTGHESSSECYLPKSLESCVNRMSKIANVFGTRYNGTVKFICSGGRVRTSAARNTYTMYQKLISKSSGRTKTEKFVLNKKCQVRHFNRLVDTDQYYNQQVTSRGKMFMGSLKKISGRWYVKDSLGMMAYNTIAADRKGKYYYFDNKGRMFKKGWKWVKGNKYYFNPARVKGWKRIGGKTYYFIDNSYKGYRKSQEGIMLTGFRTVGGKRYYFIDKNYKGYKSGIYGVRAVGWATISGNVYYMNKAGVIQTGLVKINSDLYNFGKSGKRVTGWATIAGKKYYFQTGGKALRGRDATISRHRYRFDANGVMTGEINCHLDSKGNPIIGWHEINGKRYYGGSGGELATGRVVIDGVEYLFDTIANGCALLSSPDPQQSPEGNTSTGGANERAPGEKVPGIGSDSTDQGKTDENARSSEAEVAEEIEPEKDTEEEQAEEAGSADGSEEAGADGGAEEPAADSSSEEPAADSSAEEPSAGSSAEEPSAGNSAEEPSADSSAEEPSADSSAEEPSADSSAEEPSAGNIAEEDATDSTSAAANNAAAGNTI